MLTFTLKNFVRVALVLATTQLVVGGEPVTLNRYTIDGGGTMSLVGGDFSMSSTIGQADAATNPLVGGNYEINGGFWFAHRPGDCNEDGGLDLLDYQKFQACESGPNSTRLNDLCICSDMDRDADVDLRDFSVLQRQDR